MPSFLAPPSPPPIRLYILKLEYFFVNSFMIWALLSGELLSIMITSMSLKVCAATLSRHCLIYFSTLYTGMISDTLFIKTFFLFQYGQGLMYIIIW